MRDKFQRVLLAGVLILLAALFFRPYVDDYLYSTTTPQPIEARGNLSDMERTTIAIFNNASPSVVQVVGRTGGGQQVNSEGEHVVGVQTGTGFIWDEAGRSLEEVDSWDQKSPGPVRRGHESALERSAAVRTPAFGHEGYRGRATPGRVSLVCAQGSSLDEVAGRHGQKPVFVSAHLSGREGSVLSSSRPLGGAPPPVRLDSRLPERARRVW